MSAIVGAVALLALGSPATALADNAPALPTPPLMVSPAAPAGPQYPLTPETERMGVETAHILFKDVDFKALLNGQLDSMDQTFASIHARPEWAGLMREAALEELANIHPLMERMVGRGLAHSMTPEELQAGLTFLRGPAGEETAKLIAQSAAHRDQPTAPTPPVVAAEMRKLLRTPAGRAWVEKFSHIETILNGVTEEFVSKFVIDLLQRFVDKAQANEAAHHSD